MHLGDYAVTTAVKGDEQGITQTHARAFETAYLNPAMGATAEALARFVYDTRPEIGFLDRKQTYWASMIANKQADQSVSQILYVARDQAANKIVGVGLGQMPKRTFYSGYGVSCNPNDEITALYVDPDHQRRGIGSALLKALMGHMSPIVVVKVTAGSAAADFYKHRGFRERPTPLGVAHHPSFYGGIRLPQIIMAHGSNPYFTPPRPARIERLSQTT